CETVLKVGVAVLDATFGLRIGNPGREYGDCRHRNAGLKLFQLCFAEGPGIFPCSRNVPSLVGVSPSWAGKMCLPELRVWDRSIVLVKNGPTRAVWAALPGIGASWHGSDIRHREPEKVESGKRKPLRKGDL